MLHSIFELTNVRKNLSQQRRSYHY